MYRLHSNSVSDFGGFFFLSAPLSNFPAKAEESSTFVCLYGIRKTRKYRANHREMSHCSKKIVSRNELREIGARDVNVFIANFLLQVREFLFLICV